MPRDRFDNPTALAFGFTQSTEDANLPVGRLAQYIYIPNDQDVCQYCIIDIHVVVIVAQKLNSCQAYSYTQTTADC